MVILKQNNSEATCTFSYPLDKKQEYIELIFHWENEEEYKTANVRIDINKARLFVQQLQETVFSKELNDIL